MGINNGIYSNSACLSSRRLICSLFLTFRAMWNLRFCLCFAIIFQILLPFMAILLSDACLSKRIFIKRVDVTEPKPLEYIFYSPPGPIQEEIVGMTANRLARMEPSMGGKYY